MTQLQASVVVRSFNEQETVRACMESVRAQTAAAELILVDSGSSDETVAIAQPYCDAVIHIPSECFTFGRALNIGTQRAHGDVVFALSSHCAYPDPTWIERSLLHYEADHVAGVSGLLLDTAGRYLPGPRRVTFADVRNDPHWGFSNHASSWRRTVWKMIPFDETTRSSEDKQWMWRVMLSGWDVVIDPTLHIGAPHRRQAGLVKLSKRVFWEHEVIASMIEVQPRPLSRVAAEWWSSFPWPSSRRLMLRRVSPWRNVELLAGVVGERIGCAARTDATIRLPECEPSRDA